MSNALRAAALILAAGIGLSDGAQAADLTPAPVYTQVRNESGFYIGSVSAASFLDRTTFRLNGAVVRTDYEVDSYFAARAGYAFGRFYGVFLPRLDVEGGYGRSAVRRHEVNGTRFAGVDSFGEARSFQGYGNLYVDIDLGFALRPYIGGGIGAADVRLRRQGVSPTGTVIDSSDTVMAYHYDAGIAMDLGRLGLFGGSSLFQGTVLEVGYRRTEAPDLRFVARDGTRSKTDFSADMVTFGTRKQF